MGLARQSFEVEKVSRCYTRVYTIHSCFGGHNEDFIASGSEGKLCLC